MFSLLARYQGLCGSQKNTCTPVSIFSRACSAISAPWSHASDSRRWSGNDDGARDRLAHRLRSMPGQRRSILHTGDLSLSRSGRSLSATRRHWSLSASTSFWAKAVPMKAETTCRCGLGYVLGTTVLVRTPRRPRRPPPGNPRLGAEILVAATSPASNGLRGGTPRPGALISRSHRIRRRH